MTKEEILAMKPGRKLNKAVSENVMGRNVVLDETFGDMESYTVDNNNVWDNLPPYSEDMSAAQSVMARMTSLGHNDVSSWDQYGGGTYTQAEAICKRALLVVLGMFDE